MTVIVSVTNNLYSFLEVDRRVSAGSLVGNNNANKVICLVLRDGIFNVSFTGIAHIDGISSDDWIAGVIMGRKFDRHTNFFELAAFSIGGSGCPPFLKQVLNRIDRAIREQAAKDIRFRQNYLEVGISGQKADHGVLFKYLLIIRKPANSNNVQYGLFDRHPNRRSNRFNIYISGGWGERHPDIAQSLSRKVRSEKAYETIGAVNRICGYLDEAVLEFSRREISIGNEALRISHLPGVNYSKIEFITRGTAFKSPFLYGEDAGQSVHYNPWIISPGIRFPPQGMVGEPMKVHVNGQKFELDSAKLRMPAATKMAILPLVRR